MPMPSLVTVALTVSLLAAGAAPAAGQPQILGPAPANETALVTEPDGTLVCYFTDMKAETLLSIRSGDAGETWSEPEVEFETGRTHHAVFALIDHAGQTHLWYLDKQGRPSGAGINVDYFIDVLHRAAGAGAGGGWSEPTRAFHGYTGALLGAVETEPGRFIMPIGAWNHPDDDVEPDTGNNTITVVASDDAGASWRRLPVRLTSPVYPDYNGANYGAVEPALVQRGDGRLWMLFRTQTGYLYESSSRDGKTWSEAEPSRFASSNSPAALLRLSDGRLLLLWNNSAMPPRHEGDGVYGGRDALHAALYQEGRWHGFREVLRDPSRHETPPKRGDRGTAYPTATETTDGRVVVATGQGERARRILRFDPDWLLQKAASDDFAHGLSRWTAFTSVGPAERWWRDRQTGPAVIEHPDAAGQRVMHLRHADAKAAPDGAFWNFPAARLGRLTLRVQLQPGFKGGHVALTDRLFDPTEDAIPEHAMAVFLIEEDGKLPNGTSIPVGQWCDLMLRWDFNTGRVEASVDGESLWRGALQTEAPNGLSYLHLRSRPGNDTDPAGMMIDRVSAETH